MDLTVVFLIAVILSVDALIILFIVRRRAAGRKIAAKVVSDVASREGWAVGGAEGRGEIFRLVGRFGTGISWELVHIGGKKAGNSSRHPATIWSTESVGLQDSIVAVGPGLGGGFAEGVDLNHRLIRLALNRMFDPDISTALSESTVIVPDEEDFSRHYALFSDNRDLALQFVAPPVAGLLTAWAEESGNGRPPVIAWWKSGMTVKFFGAVRSADSLSGMIKLCETLSYRAAKLNR